MYIYILFILSGLMIILAGTKLSKYGDVIAVNTKLGHNVVGGILVAGATSLPEVVASVSSSLMNVPDIALGNVFGSNTFNLMILAVMDIYKGPGRLLNMVKMSHILTGSFGILLTAFSTMVILMYRIKGFDIQIGWISLSSLIIFAVYVFGSILVIRHEGKIKISVEEEDTSVKEKEEGTSLSRAILGFALASLVIVVAGIILSRTGERIAVETGLGYTFVGTLLVAATTSLPELVASLAAVKIGAYDMAVGNVFGSNMFNMVIIAASDAAYTKGSIFQAVSLEHGITAMAGIVLSSVAVIGLFYRTKRTIYSVGWDSVTIFILYLLSIYLIM